MFAPAFGASRFLAGTDQKHFTYPAATQAEEIKQRHDGFSFLVMATLTALVSGTGHIHREFGQFSGFQQGQVFQHTAFHGPEHPDS
jgi:CHASE1-domain containing sensor protein